MLAAYKSFGENLQKIIVEVDDVIVRIDNEHQEWNHLAKKLTETTDGLVINGTCQLEEDSNGFSLRKASVTCSKQAPPTRDCSLV